MTAIAPRFRILTLHQPWAQLMWDGRKGVETRSWRTTYRGLLGVHSSRRVGKGFLRAAQEFGYTEDDLPLGVLGGVTRLVNVVSTTEAIERGLVAPDEVKYGDYRPGRFAWITEGMRLLEAPFILPGALGCWRPAETWPHWPDLNAILRRLDRRPVASAVR